MVCAVSGELSESSTNPYFQSTLISGPETLPGKGVVFVSVVVAAVEPHLPVDLKDQAPFIFQTFIEKPRECAVSVFRKAVSHTNGGCGRHLPPELRMFSSQT